MARWQLKRRGGKVPTQEAVKALELLKKLLRQAQRQHGDSPLEAIRMDGMPGSSVECVGGRIVETEIPCKPDEPGFFVLLGHGKRSASVEFNELCTQLMKVLKKFGIHVHCPPEMEPGARWLFIVTEVLQITGTEIRCCGKDEVVPVKWIQIRDVFGLSAIAVEMLFASHDPDKKKRDAEERTIRAVMAVRKDPTLTLAQLAKLVDVSPSTLSRDPMVRAARKAAVTGRTARKRKVDPRTREPYSGDEDE